MTAVAERTEQRPRKTEAAFTLVAARNVLLDALTRAASAVQAKTTLPIAKMALVEVEGSVLEGPGSVKLTTTDFEQRLTTTFGATVMGAGRAALPVERLREIVANLPSVSTVTIEVRGMKARVTAGRSRFDLVGMAPDEYPMGAELRPVIEATVVNGLARVAPFVSNKESRISLNAALLSASDRGLSLVGCDGHRLFRVQLAETSPFRAECSIPRQCFGVIRRVFKDDETLALDASASELRLSGDSSSLHLRLSAEPYPDTNPVFAHASKFSAIVNGDLLVEAVKRATTIEDDFQSPRLWMTWREGEVRLVCASTDAGRAEDVLECRYVGEKPSDKAEHLIVNPKYLLSALESLGTDDAGDVVLQMPESSNLFYLRHASTPEAFTMAAILTIRASEPPEASADV
jgi:DNA polymerase III subunit beta